MKLITLFLFLINSYSFAHLKEDGQLSEKFKKLSKEQIAKLNQEFKLRTTPLLDRYNTGDIVGNGGGIVEQNFAFAFNSVPNAIGHCLAKMNCNLSVDEKLVLLDIRATFYSKLERDFQFVFVTEEDSDGLFNDQLDPSERLAKTGFSKDFPIFINLSLIEESDSYKVDPSAALGLIIHELGHQSGYKSHTMLDTISSKLRVAFSYELEHLDYEINNETLFVNIYTREDQFNTQISYLYNHRLGRLSSRIEEKLSCSVPTQRVAGNTITNEHWQRKKFINDRIKVELTAWIDVYCEDENGIIWTEERDLKIKFFFKLDQKKVDEVQIEVL